MATVNATDEILTVNYFARDGGDYITYCPHCQRVVCMDGDEPVRGEQFQDRICGGWFDVASDAVRVKSLSLFPSARAMPDTGKERE